MSDPFAGNPHAGIRLGSDADETPAIAYRCPDGHGDSAWPGYCTSCGRLLELVEEQRP